MCPPDSNGLKLKKKKHKPYFFFLEGNILNIILVSTSSLEFVQIPFSSVDVAIPKMLLLRTCLVKR